MRRNFGLFYFSRKVEESSKLPFFVGLNLVSLKIVIRGLEYYYISINKYNTFMIVFNLQVFINDKDLLTRLSYGPAVSIKYYKTKEAWVIQEILSVENALPFCFDRHHVKSHQYDKVSNINVIPIPKLINKRCDISADNTYHTASHPP